MSETNLPQEPVERRPVDDVVPVTPVEDAGTHPHEGFAQPHEGFIADATDGDGLMVTHPGEDAGVVPDTDEGVTGSGPENAQIGGVVGAAVPAEDLHDANPGPEH